MIGQYKKWMMLPTNHFHFIPNSRANLIILNFIYVVEECTVRVTNSERYSTHMSALLFLTRHPIRSLHGKF